MSYKNSERFTMPNPKDVPRETYHSLIKWMSTEDREREMAFAIALYEDRKLLQEQLLAAVACRTKKQKLKVYREWLATLSEIRVAELVEIMNNKHVLQTVLGWKLTDPRH